MKNVGSSKSMRAEVELHSAPDLDLSDDFELFKTQ